MKKLSLKLKPEKVCSEMQKRSENEKYVKNFQKLSVFVKLIYHEQYETFLVYNEKLYPQTLQTERPV